MPTTARPIDLASQTDEALLAAFARGDRAALAELARRHERPLLGLCNGLLGGQRDQAMDVVQETWLRVIRFAPNFNGSSTVKTWLYRITINQCRTMQAKVVRDAKRDADEAKPETAAAPFDDSGFDGIRAAVARLDIDRRTVILLCYHAGVTHEQAAEIIGVPVGTLKSRLHAALQRLRALMPQEVRT